MSAQAFTLIAAAARLFACSRWAITCSSISYADLAVMPTRQREHLAGRRDGQERSA